MDTESAERPMQVAEQNAPASARGAHGTIRSRPDRLLSDSRGRPARGVLIDLPRSVHDQLEIQNGNPGPGAAAAHNARPGLDGD
jgi:hypothetical protein